MANSRKRERSGQTTNVRSAKQIKLSAPQITGPATKLTTRSNDSSQCIYQFFETSGKNRKKVLSLLAQRQQAVQKAPIAIIYRPDGDGKGAYYDHYTIQKITQTQTLIATSPGEDIQQFAYYHASVTNKLSFSKPYQHNNQQYSLPPTLEQQAAAGLLFIPGVSQSEFVKDSYEERLKQQFTLIKKALNSGQPILSVCGGSWVLWQYYKGQLMGVKDHNYRAGMPRILDTNGSVGYNVQIHRIKIASDALLLRAALGLKPNDTEELPVNSVHSYAVKASKNPLKTFLVSATAQTDDDLAPTNGHSPTKEKIQPEKDTIEAVESKFGAPIICVQWHPEAYLPAGKKSDTNTKKQQDLLRYMQKAGQTYANRQNLNREFLAQFKDVKSNLKKTELIGMNYGVCKDTKNKIEFRLFRLQNTGQLRHKDEAFWEKIAKEEYFIEKITKN